MKIRIQNRIGDSGYFFRNNFDTFQKVMLYLPETFPMIFRKVVFFLLKSHRAIGSIPFGE